MSEETISYKHAMDELEAIVSRIEGDDVDLDKLTTDVERAAELIRLCRQKIRATEAQVREVVTQLDSEPS
ncbi:MAG: exodeoxyribonuclease VII small subunit [bacterium]